MKKDSNWNVLTRGILKENPVLVLILGTCPTLAMTRSVTDAVGMGLAVIAVLVCSNIFISLLRNLIPATMRIPCYIVIIAGFVTVVDLMLQAFLPDLAESLGVFIPLIVVNCIILGRAEMFASKNGIFDSALDGLGMGIGFTITLTIMGSIREILGSGTWMSGLDGILPFLPKGFAIQVLPIEPFTIMTSAPGGFFCYGFLMAMVVLLEMKTNNRIERKIGCAVEEGEDN